MKAWAVTGVAQALTVALMLIVPGLVVFGLSARGVQTARLSSEYLLAELARSHYYTEDTSLPQWAGPLAIGGVLAIPAPGQAFAPTERPRVPRHSGPFTIVIDPGHGGREPGAVHYTKGGKVDLTERDTSLDIAVRLQRYLQQAGHQVFLTHQNGPERAVSPMDLGARIRFARDVQADLFLSLHHNGSINPRQAGVEVWYCENHPLGRDNRRLAQLVLDNVLERLRQQGYTAVNRGIKEDAYYHATPECQFYATRWLPMPSVLAELLFMTNDADAEALKQAANRDAIARGLARAVLSFLE